MVYRKNKYLHSRENEVKQDCTVLLATFTDFPTKLYEPFYRPSSQGKQPPASYSLGL